MIHNSNISQPTQYYIASILMTHVTVQFHILTSSVIEFWIADRPL